VKFNTLVPNWTLQIREVSPAAYEMIATDPHGRSVTAVGGNEVELTWEITGAVVDFAKRNGLSIPSSTKHLRPNDVVERLPSLLRSILISELLDGNAIAETWTEWGTVVKLRRRLSNASRNCSEPLEYVEVADPHYCYDEIRLPGTDAMIAAG
jgi:hypothetical protein